MFLLVAALAPSLGAGWETGGHDPRRTGQSTSVGPSDPTWVADLPISEVNVFNAPPAVDEDGLMVWGSWGVVQQTTDSSDPRSWDKLDGSVIALTPQLEKVWSRRAEFAVTPFCYDYGGREDLSWCPAGGQVTFHNGIVDSTPTLTGEGAAWVARGDGRLYEVDLSDGDAELILQTWNPEDVDDPDGGGALLASPLALPDGSVLVASVGAGPYETHAIYAVERGGGLRWRLPSDVAGYSLPFWAAPALSPDGSTAYLAGWTGPGFNDVDEDLTLEGLLLAVDLGATDDASDEERVAWSVAPVSGEAAPLYVRTLSVGADGTLFLGGLAGEAETAWVVAYAPDGTWLWGTLLDLGVAELVRGLALHEEGGTTVRVLVTTGHRASGEEGGRLHALDPGDGSVVWTFDPEDHRGHGAPSGIAVDARGTSYFSTHGAERKGAVYAVDVDGEQLWHFCDDEYEGAHPIITPAGDVVVGEGDWLECALKAPSSNTCRSSATERVVRIWYADEDDAPFGARLAWRCCRCSTGAGPVGVVPWLVLVGLVRRRRSR